MEEMSEPKLLAPDYDRKTREAVEERGITEVADALDLPECCVVKMVRGEYRPLSDTRQRFAELTGTSIEISESEAGWL